MRPRRLSREVNVSGSRGRMRINARTQRLVEQGGSVRGAQKSGARPAASLPEQKPDGAVPGPTLPERGASSALAASGWLRSGADRTAGQSEAARERDDAERTVQRGTKSGTAGATRAASSAMRHGVRAGSGSVTTGRAVRGGVTSQARRTTAAARRAGSARVAASSASRAQLAIVQATARAAAAVKAVATSAVTIATSTVPLIVISVVLVIVIVVLSMISFLLPVMQAGCGTNQADAVRVDVAKVPQGPVAGYGHENLVIAAHIMNAAYDQKLTLRDQTVGVMTAMGESGLQLLPYGDTAGPDSRGPFQQRDNWGPLAVRMDPYKSAGLFFTALVQKVSESERASMEPTLIAHTVQVNADKNHYTPYWEAAGQVVQVLSGGPAEHGMADACSAFGGNPPGGGTPGQIGTNGWARPATGPVTSPFGMRDGPYPNHTGTDFAAGGCGGPIWAAKDGTVKFVGLDELRNGVIYVDHGQGLETRYVHMFPDGIFVRKGQKVKAGQQIAAAGASGAAFGCHLHFEVLSNGVFVDPLPVLTRAGIKY